MTIANAISAANVSARKLFGADICIVVARSPAFGNDDVLVVVQGGRHAEAAAGFAGAVRGARLRRVNGTCFFTKKPVSHTEVQWVA